MRTPLVATLLAIGCVGDDDGKGDDSGACAVTLDESNPADGATGVYGRSRVEFELSDEDPFAEVTIDGVTGATSRDGDHVYFTPDAPLDPNTTYTATITWCGGSESVTFSTSDLGTPLADPTSIAGRVFAIPFGEGRIVEPSSLASQLYPYVTQIDLLAIDAVLADTILITNGLANEVEAPPYTQDWCMATVDFGAAAFSEAPYFEVQTDELPMTFASVDVVLRGVTFRGTFAADGLSVGGGEVTYHMDTRALDIFVDPDVEGSLCDTAERLGAECYACPETGEPYCLDFWLDGLSGEVIDLQLDPVPCPDLPDCATQAPPADATCE
jgi:hypothetical protein